MSRLTCTAPAGGSIKDAANIDWNKVDIDELVDQLSPDEIQQLLEECDPDDPHLPPSARCTYHCDKLPTGPLNRKALRDFINEQAKKMPDKMEHVPYVPGVVRGKKWVPPKQENIMEGYGFEDDIELDLDEETEAAFAEASDNEVVDLAAILGFHSMMTQDQWHESHGTKFAGKADANLGWDGITKATPLKWYPPEEPNRTNPNEVIEKLEQNHRSMKNANLNNIPLKEEKLLELFEALRHNTSMEELSLANVTLSDFAAANLACALENNIRLEKLNIESNNITPNTLIKIFEAANVQQQLTDIKAANQAAQYLGNRVEMAITSAVEKNKALLRVGVHFEYGDCRNRVAVQLQKNLDRIRLKRVAAKMKNGCAGGYIISSHPSGMIMCTTNVQNDEGIEEEISYLGTTLFGQKKQKLAKTESEWYTKNMQQKHWIEEEDDEDDDDDDESSR